MTKTAQKATEKLFEKYASEPTYPISRAWQGYQDIGSLGLTKFVHDRAAQGRATRGSRPLTPTEAEKFKALKGLEADGRTYPFSRAFTNPTVSGVAGAGAGALSGAGLALSKGKSTALGAPLGAAAYGGAYYLQGVIDRITRARADQGKANIGRKGIGKRKKKQLDAMRS